MLLTVSWLLSQRLPHIATAKDWICLSLLALPQLTWAPVLILQSIGVSEQLSRIKIWWKTHFGFSEKVWNLSKPAGSLPSSSLRGMNFYWLGRNTVSRVHLGCCQRLISLLRRSHIGYIFEGYVLKHIDRDMKTLLFLSLDTAWEGDHFSSQTLFRHWQGVLTDQGGNKQKRHRHFLLLRGGPNWPFRCLENHFSPFTCPHPP